MQKSFIVALRGNALETGKSRSRKTAYLQRGESQPPEHGCDDNVGLQYALDEHPMHLTRKQLCGETRLFIRKEKRKYET